ncbi:hypothetical protein RHGRI_017274 [Rhododendron griersonianum]|uniref:PB1-like domain-containing protein n=1 Tax=Rhododendron griersonianum TaxID=479676 RepID=A0AAV6JX67_9ERIC|nr:hypothetical protein RHGRI_017274 [Rhododendron griersonianum]
MLEMEAMAKDHLGYSGRVAFYYKKPGLSLDKGLVPFSTDKEVYQMLDFLDKDRVAKVYLEHEGCEALLESQVGSSNVSAAHQSDPHRISGVEVCDLTQESTFGNAGPSDIGPTDLENGFGFQQLLMDCGVGFDIEFGSDENNANGPEGVELGFKATEQF